MEALARRSATSGGPVGDLSTALTVVGRATCAASVEELFAHHADLRAIVIGDAPDGPVLVTRSEFSQIIPGARRFGRELYGRRPIGDLPFSQALVVAGDLRVYEVSALMLAREASRRYDDGLVVHEDGSLGLLQASVVIEALAAQFAHQATHDKLTGLANRAQLSGRLLAGHEVARATAVLFIDLDRFKIVNDSLGHAEPPRHH